MKKLICSLLIIIIAFGCVSALAVEEITVTEQMISPERCTGCYVKYVSEVEEIIVSEEDIPLDTVETQMYGASLMSLDSDGFNEVQVTDYYGYNVLLKEDAKLAAAYLRLLEGASNEEWRITIANGKLTEDEIEKVFYACHNDNPQLFNVSNGRYITLYQMLGSICVGTVIEPIYSSNLNIEEHSAKFVEAADDIILTSGVKPDMSDYDKAIALYNELALRVTYDKENLAKHDADMSSATTDAEINEILSKYAFMHSAYAAMVDGKAVCDGYSKAYQYLLYKVGINSHIATGTGGGGGHAWNLVQLDGKWYYTDLTWGDTNDIIIFYEYFNMTEEMLIDNGHEFEEPYANPYSMPECTSTDHNYFTVNGGIMTSDNMDIDNIVAQLKKNSYARIYLTDDASASDIKAWYKDHIAELVRRVDDDCSAYVDPFGMGRECILELFHDTIAPMKNVGVEICSTTDNVYKFYAGFYDENGMLTGIDEIPNLNLEANKIVTVKPTNIPDNFKEIKYFIWDKENGLKPIYNVATATY